MKQVESLKLFFFQNKGSRVATEIINMILQQETLEPPPVASRKKRGPYRTLAGGTLPKRRSEESIQKLAWKAALKAQKLEYMTQAMKRRENRIVELEKLLEVANQRTHRNSEEEDLLLPSK